MGSCIPAFNLPFKCAQILSLISDCTWHKDRKTPFCCYSLIPLLVKVKEYSHYLSTLLNLCPLFNEHLHFII